MYFPRGWRFCFKIKYWLHLMAFYISIAFLCWPNLLPSLVAKCLEWMHKIDPSDCGWCPLIVCVEQSRWRRSYSIGWHRTWSSVRLIQKVKGSLVHLYETLRGVAEPNTSSRFLFFLNQIVLWESLCVYLLYCGKLWHMLYTVWLSHTQKHTH